MLLLLTVFVCYSVDCFCCCFVGFVVNFVDYYYYYYYYSSVLAFFTHFWSFLCMRKVYELWWNACYSQLMYLSSWRKLLLFFGHNHDNNEVYNFANNYANDYINFTQNDDDNDNDNDSNNGNPTGDHKQMDAVIIIIMMLMIVIIKLMIIIGNLLLLLLLSTSSFICYYNLICYLGLYHDFNLGSCWCNKAYTQLANRS